MKTSLYRAPHAQKGFTLIEIAIVLVIIGLLLGGVLKGQEMIESGRIKNVVNDFNGISAAYNTYRDRYRAIPGDDIGAVPANRGWAGITGLGPGDGNGNLGVAANPAFAGGNTESTQFWLHLRGAQLIGGSTTTGVAVASLPSNAYNGRFGVRQASAVGVLGGFAPLALCASNLPAKAAIAIDTQLDDGSPATGSIRATQFATAANQEPAAAAVNYIEPNFYTVCRQL